VWHVGAQFGYHAHPVIAADERKPTPPNQETNRLLARDERIGRFMFLARLRRPLPPAPNTPSALERIDRTSPRAVPPLRRFDGPKLLNLTR
jgi:hypothetical protein